MGESVVSRWVSVLACAVVLMLAACANEPGKELVYPDDELQYLIGPGDTVNVFVWGNPELSITVPVRPDGRITTPLVQDLPASGKTPTQLARDIEKSLEKFIRTPNVTVIVTGFVGLPSAQIRVVGAAAEPKTIPYRRQLTVLDVMIEVGGLGEFADGNDARIVRSIEGKQVKIPVRLADLLRDGDISANVVLYPGDIIIIPEALF